MQRTTFEDFLTETIVSRPGYGIRENLLFAVLKDYCKNYRLPMPTWAQFHVLLKQRGIQKMLHSGITALIGFGWNRNSAYTPDDARDYALPAPGDAPPMRRTYAPASSRRTPSVPVSAVPVRTPPRPDDDDPAPWD